MNAFYLLLMRGVIGLGFAVLIMRTFYPGTGWERVIGLCVILVGLAYFAEYLRKRRRK